jgi:hypothetical protein
LYIKSKDKIIAIGASGIDDDDENIPSTPGNGGNNNNTMDESDLLELLKSMGIVVDEDNNGDYSNIHVNNIADLTFIHQDTGAKFKFTVDAEGNIVSTKVVDLGKLEDDTYVKSLISSSNTNSNANIRGFIGTRGAYIYKEKGGSNATSSNVNDITSNIGLYSDRLKIGAVYAPLDTDERFGCSHGYIELENTSDMDYNLDGMYLHFA